MGSLSPSLLLEVAQELLDSLVWYCQFDVSPVNYSDSEMSCSIIGPHWPLCNVFDLRWSWI